MASAVVSDILTLSHQLQSARQRRPSPLRSLVDVHPLPFRCGCLFGVRNAMCARMSLISMDIALTRWLATLLPRGSKPCIDICEEAFVLHWQHVTLRDVLLQTGIGRSSHGDLMAMGHPRSGVL